MLRHGLTPSSLVRTNVGPFAPRCFLLSAARHATFSCTPVNSSRGSSLKRVSSADFHSFLAFSSFRGRPLRERKGRHSGYALLFLGRPCYMDEQVFHAEERRPLRRRNKLWRFMPSHLNFPTKSTSAHD